METEKILFVDDEPNLLEAVKRQFRREFSITTATRGEDGLRILIADGPFAVVVSDLRMPVMDGIQFLTKAREVSPDCVRMMLTGNADLSAAMQAVNEGNIFRFLSKPCHPDVLGRALHTALDQYRLIMAERELLEKTLHGSVKVLTDLLAVLSPLAFGRASRVKRYVRGIVKLVAESTGLDGKAPWQFEMAAMLSQIGCIVLPPSLLKKVFEGAALSSAEQSIYDRHPNVGRELLANIPRLEPIAEMIRYQDLHFEGPGVPQGTSIPMGARILKVVLDYDLLTSTGDPSATALASLYERSGWYDPSVLQALKTLVGLEARFEVKRVAIRELEAGMILAEDIVSGDGQLLIAKGFELSPSILRRLEHYAVNSQLREPVCVLVPTLKAAVSEAAGQPVLAAM
jgi:response regulator RpfG family c-di-GMP phosphodiesterase